MHSEARAWKREKVEKERVLLAALHIKLLRARSRDPGKQSIYRPGYPLPLRHSIVYEDNTAD